MREDYDFSLSTENPYARALRKEATKELSEMPPSDHLLALTAHWTAAVRAQESTRQDRLFDDPWAAALAGPEGTAWLEQRPPGSTVPMVLRTRFFDHFVQRIAVQDGIRQIVLMATGLNTRDFRLAWPERTQLFELDQPAVLKIKDRIPHRPAPSRPAHGRSSR